MSRLKRILCYIGIHNWEFRSEVYPHGAADFARCKNPRCPRYSVEMLVNYEQRYPRVSHD